MLNYIEAYGTGFRRIYDLYEKFNLTPEIVVLPNFFRLIMPNIKYKDNVGLNNLQSQIILLIQSNPYITQKEMATELGVTTRTIERNISELKEKSRITKTKSKKAGEWIVLE